MNTPSSSSPPRPAGILEQMTVEEVRTFEPDILLVPLGSTEPHGPHLPYGTDTAIADRISQMAVERANSEGARVLRLPAMPFGNNVNFKNFPFACRLRVETLMAVVMDLVAFGVEEGVRKFVLFNCHGGNDAALQASLRQVFDHFQNEAFVVLCGTGTFCPEAYQEIFSDGSPHAGEYETSIMQHVAPGMMPDTQPVETPMRSPVIPELVSSGSHWVRNWAHLMPAACGGRPDLATAEKGRLFVERAIPAFAKFLVNLSREPWHARFPYSPTHKNT